MSNSPHSSTTIFDIQHLALGHQPGQWIVQIEKLQLFPGDRLVICGPTGSGKTMLVETLFGFFPPRMAGQIRLFGEILEDKSADRLRSRLGAVFQNPEDQLLCTTVEEEIRFGAENLGLREEQIQQNVRQLVQVLGLERVLSHSPGQLSWGEKKKVVLAGALAAEPQLLVADDMLSGLGGQDRNRVMDVLEFYDGACLLAHPADLPEQFQHWQVVQL